MGFSLNDGKNGLERVFCSEHLQSMIDQIITKEEFWDCCIPKKCSEFLIYGSAFSPKPVRGISVFARVDNTSKLLMVFGEREWTEFGVSQAQYFASMPIDYENAYGGNGYIYNPVGKGYSEDGSSIKLPNIELADRLVLSREDTPDIAGFKPYKLDWEQRRQYFSHNKEFNLKSEIIPDDATPEWFNVAPLDQRIDGFFVGHEEIEVRNMHPFIPLIKSSLPNLRLRLFVVKKSSGGKYEFSELAVNCETLFLLPSWERGILVFRASFHVNDLMASDVACMLTATELLSDEPQSINHYHQYMIKNMPEHIATLVAKNNTAFKRMKSADSIVANQDACNVSDSLSFEQRFVEVFFDKLRNIDDLKKLGNNKLTNLMMQFNELMRHFGVSKEDLLDLINTRKEQGKSGTLSEFEQLEIFKRILNDEPESFDGLKHSIQTLESVKTKLFNSFNET